MIMIIMCRSIEGIFFVKFFVEGEADSLVNLNLNDMFKPKYKQFFDDNLLKISGFISSIITCKGARDILLKHFYAVGEAHVICCVIGEFTVLTLNQLN